MIQDLLKPEIALFFVDGLYITLRIAVLTILFSLVFGTILGIAQYSRHPIYGRMATVYIDAIRNTPLLLFILAVRFTTTLQPVNSGILAMTIFTSAVMAEIVLPLFCPNSLQSLKTLHLFGRLGLKSLQEKA